MLEKVIDDHYWYLFRAMVPWSKRKTFQTPSASLHPVLPSGSPPIHVAMGGHRLLKAFRHSLPSRMLPVFLKCSCCPNLCVSKRTFIPEMLLPSRFVCQ